MNAIITKWLGVTDTKGDRIKASDNNGHTITVSRYREDLNQLDGKDLHQAVAYELCEKIGVAGMLVSGRIDDAEYAHIFT
jgi:hypothetical protein